MRQNKKSVLIEFLFGAPTSSESPDTGSNPNLDSIKGLEEKIQNLQNQVNSLQQKVIHLEAKLFDLMISHSASFKENSKYALSGTLEVPESTKIIQQGDSTLKPNKGSYLQENYQKTHSEMREVPKLHSNVLSEDYKSPLKTAKPIEESIILSNQNEAQNSPNFITLSKIPEQDRIEIIKTGFRLNQEGKKYYESTQESSLFKLKGYSIKYETIRRTKLYQNLND